MCWRTAGSVDGMARWLTCNARVVAVAQDGGEVWSDRMTGTDYGIADDKGNEAEKEMEAEAAVEGGKDGAVAALRVTASASQEGQARQGKVQAGWVIELMREESVKESPAAACMQSMRGQKQGSVQRMMMNSTFPCIRTKLGERGPARTANLMRVVVRPDDASRGPLSEASEATSAEHHLLYSMLHIVCCVHARNIFYIHADQRRLGMTQRSMMMIITTIPINVEATRRALAEYHQRLSRPPADHPKFCAPRSSLRSLPTVHCPVQQPVRLTVFNHPQESCCGPTKVYAVIGLCYCCKDSPSTAPQTWCTVEAGVAPASRYGGIHYMYLQRNACVRACVRACSATIAAMDDVVLSHHASMAHVAGRSGGQRICWPRICQANKALPNSFGSHAQYDSYVGDVGRVAMLQTSVGHRSPRRPNHPKLYVCLAGNADPRLDSLARVAQALTEMICTDSTACRLQAWRYCTHSDAPPAESPIGTVMQMEDCIRQPDVRLTELYGTTTSTHKPDPSGGKCFFDHLSMSQVVVTKLSGIITLCLLPFIYKMFETAFQSDAKHQNHCHPMPCRVKEENRMPFPDRGLTAARSMRSVNKTKGHPIALHAETCYEALDDPHKPVLKHSCNMQRLSNLAGPLTPLL
ncbi:uncharacterized protein MYCFIDRAFT_173068 [Pseudocercospora fijiensis CIRAD86]|uniref:Uncharacterized protein n=1 Tax=Pseudocercospora fijiensis (strain CIRAD86) TaxID=383855 RepID=M2Z2E0_PSEFD|nr:uncharacterized protein MYCFIDRAFT_173068 [Pseudocercospora fijiensis CIRAD86]EME84005.1 hypothetical protein MYCFIDRAFT_173068 [Pseudocercospora fijiensis CIRAD86]